MEFRRKVFFNIILLGFIIISTIFIHTNVYADNTITVDNMEDLLSEISKSKNRGEGDTSINKIVLNPGIYNAYTHISIPSNTCIDLNGNTINYNFNQQTSSNKYAFNIAQDAKNVEITNGTISGGGLYGKGVQKIKLSKVTFKDCTAAGICIKDKSTNIELNNLNFNNVSEDGIFIVESSINVLSKITCTNSTRGIYLKSSKAKDIEDCNISNTSSEGIRLVSSHVGNIKNNKVSNGKNVGILLRGPTDKLDGSSAGNIENNTITNCKGDGIGIYHGSYCKEIIKNTLDLIGGNHNGNAGDYGIIIDSMMKAKTYCSRIAGNTIKRTTYAGIAIYSGPGSSLSEIYKDTAYVEKNIENNKLINCGTYKHSEGWKKESKQGCISGIYIDTHALVKGNICGNTIDTTGENGIYIHLCSNVNSIYNNTIKNCKEFGIHVYQLSKLRGNIEKNKIYNCGKNGISVTKSSIVNGVINANTIDNIQENGIYIRESIIKNITNNKLNNIKNVGICLNVKGKGVDIISNSISMNNIGNGFGIRVVENSVVRKIQKNTIKGKMVNGIRIVGISNNIEISSNNVSTTNPNKKEFMGIYVSGNKSNKIAIKKNTVIGNKTNYGMRLAQGKANIINNTVKNSTYPIYVEKNNLAVKVKENKISNNKSNVIRTTKAKVDIGNIEFSSVKAKKGAKIKLGYKSSNEISKYEIYQATAKKGSYKKIKTTNKTKYTTSKLKANKKYFYKVCGYVKDGKISVYTNYSKIKSIKTKK